jgi:hypothetical protein
MHALKGVVRHGLGFQPKPHQFHRKKTQFQEKA